MAGCSVTFGRGCAVAWVAVAGVCGCGGAAHPVASTGCGWVGGWSGRVGGVVSGCGVLWRVVGCAGDAGAGGQRCEGEWVGGWVNGLGSGWMCGWVGGRRMGGCMVGWRSGPGCFATARYSSGWRSEPGPSARDYQSAVHPLTHTHPHPHPSDTTPAQTHTVPYPTHITHTHFLSF